MRAFARDTGLSPSRLSEAVNGVRGISLAAARKICRGLNLPPEDRELFLLSVSARHARSAAERKKAARSLARKHSVAAQRPEKVATRTGWIDAALLKMHECGRSLADTASVAALLRVPEFMVVSSLRFLTRLGFVKGLQGYKDYLGAQSSGRRLNTDYQQILDKAGAALAPEAEHAGVFLFEPFMLRKENLARAGRILEEALAEIKNLEADSADAAVYFAAVQMYPVETGEDRSHDRKN